MSKNHFAILVLTASLLAPADTSFAQAPAPRTSVTRVSLRNAGRARVSVTKGRLRKTIDLSEEVVGCGYLSGAAAVRFRKRGCAAPPASFKLIDATAQNGNTYLVVLSEASDNCNVCGRCGASEALTLIWLELDANLRVRNKKSVAVQDCMLFIDLVIGGAADEARADQDHAFFLKSNTLVVDFEKRVFEEGPDNKSSYRFSHLQYDRRQPALGLIVTTETRQKSAQ